MSGIYIPYSVHSGDFNMEYDEELLNTAIEKALHEPILRFYGWSPACVSLGRNQSDEHINKSFCRYHKIDIVKRLTGGRALLHDNELTYSFVCPADFLKHGESVINSYKEISGAIALGLRKAGIQAEFPQNKKASTNFEYCMSLSTGADLSYNGRKIVGSAQFRKHGYILQHGSLMFDYDSELIKNIFGENPQEDKITTINQISSLKLDELCSFLKAGFEEYFCIEFKPYGISKAFEKS